MRHQGRIASWNPQRGFGFIKQDQGGADLFVHITALQFDGRLPEVGERVSYQVESGKDDKPCAVQVFFPDRPLSLADGLRPSIESPMPDRGNRADVNMRAPQPAMPRARVHHAPRRKGNWRGKLVPLLVLVGRRAQLLDLELVVELHALSHMAHHRVSARAAPHEA